MGAGGGLHTTSAYLGYIMSIDSNECQIYTLHKFSKQILKDLGPVAKALLA